MDTQDLLTIEEAARLIGISPFSVRKAINKGKLSVVQMFGKRLLKRADVLAYQVIGHRPRTHPERPRRPGPGRPRKEEAAQAG